MQVQVLFPALLRYKNLRQTDVSPLFVGRLLHPTRARTSVPRRRPVSVRIGGLVRARRSCRNAGVPAVWIVGHLAELMEPPLDLVAPSAGGVAREREVFAELCRRLAAGAFGGRLGSHDDVPFPECYQRPTRFGRPRYWVMLSGCQNRCQTDRGKSDWNVDNSYLKGIWMGGRVV